MKSNPYLTEVCSAEYRGFPYTIYKLDDDDECPWFAEAVDEAYQYPIKVRSRNTKEEACTWIEHAIDRWINGGRNEHIKVIRERSERFEFRTR